ncbi:hypothetical protein B0H12DRAFT_82634 [Mycena haematopus]|nr:hypothetical protein B0H12DRAFT_82634 [Mycena haematopus]
MLDSLQADRLRLLDLATRIMDLERSLLALRTEQNLVQERLDAYKYPVLTLPNELTVEIFIHFLPIYPAPPPLTGLTSPTCLTHICRQWREVALATPALWRAIQFEYDYITYERNRHIFEAWIRRSGSCPLSIDIDCHNSEVLDELIANSSLTVTTARWEHLKFAVSLSSLHKIGSSMPMLRSLDLITSFPDDNDAFTLNEAPQLRTVLLVGNVITKITLPWIHLTCLTLSWGRINRCAQILAQALNLVQCVLILDDRQLVNEPTLDDLTISLPCLESLVLSTKFSQQLEVAGFIHRFVVPALCRLEVEEVFLGAEPIPGLELFISKSRCRLQTVCITYATTNPESYQLAFPSIPTLFFENSNFGFDAASEEATDEEDSDD